MIVEGTEMTDKKRILILHTNMDIGGAETSLIGLLHALNYEHFQVDLILMQAIGSLLPLIPPEVNIIHAPKAYRALCLSIKKCILSGNLGIAFARIIGKLATVVETKIEKSNYQNYLTKRYSYWCSLPFLPKVRAQYDIAISFIDPHYIIGKKINAKVKLGWIHMDFTCINVNVKRDTAMWNNCDYIVSVSEACKKAFDIKRPKLTGKSIVVENILSKELIKRRSLEFSAEPEISQNGYISLLSIGRYSEAKNFDNVPDICSRLITKGFNIKWYIVGYGPEEEIIQRKIAEANMVENVILLGKKDNPYPYIKACDIYIQPSRDEGKCVAVREAQILNKPVVITKYATSSSQLTDGFDGIIVPMDNEGCADGIAKLLKNKELQKKLIENTKHSDYTNSEEVQKLYALVD